MNKVLLFNGRNKGHAQVIESEQFEYVRKIDKVTGAEVFEVSRVVDMHDFIQAGNVALTPAALVDLYGVTGGNQLGDEFFDDGFVKPKDLLDAHSRLIGLRSNFDKTDLSFRQRFGFDFGKFLAAYSSQNVPFDEFVGAYINVKRDVKPEEVLNDVKG